MHAATWNGRRPFSGSVDNAALRIRVSFHCTNANELIASCGWLRGSHIGDGHRRAILHSRVTKAVLNSYAIAVLGNDNAAPMPLSPRSTVRSSTASGSSSTRRTGWA